MLPVHNPAGDLEMVKSGLQAGFTMVSVGYLEHTL